MEYSIHHKLVEENEPEGVISKGKDDNGNIVYELTWKGYDDTTFHQVGDLKDCWGLLVEFEALSEAVADTHIMGAVVEYTCEDWKADDIDAAKSAKEREENAMFVPNFAKLMTMQGCKH